MQLRCYKCHKPFAISKDAVNAALDMVVADDLQHYNAQCPHCKRMNRLSKEELLRAAPLWKPPEEQETVDE